MSLGKESLKWLLFFVLSIWIGIYIFQHQEILAELKRLNVAQLASLFLILLVSFVFLAYQFRIMMRLFHIRLNIQEWFGLSMCNAMYNYFLPARGGTWLRAYYLQKKYGFSYTHYALMFFVSFLLVYITAGIVGMAAVGLYMIKTKQSVWMFFSLFPALLLLILGGSAVLKRVLTLPLGNRFQRLQRVLYEIHNGFSFFRSNPRLVLEFCLVRSLVLICNGAAYGLCLKSLGVETISLLLMTGVMALTSFSALLSLTPGNLGVRESIMGISCSSLGIPLDIALLAACIVRAASIVFVFSFGLYYSRVFVKNISI